MLLIEAKGAGICNVVMPSFVKKLFDTPLESFLFQTASFLFHQSAIACSKTVHVAHTCVFVPPVSLMSLRKRTAWASPT